MVFGRGALDVMKNAPCNTIQFLPRQRKHQIHGGRPVGFAPRMSWFY